MEGLEAFDNTWHGTEVAIERELLIQIQAREVKAKAVNVGKAKSQEPLNLSPISIGQQLIQTGFMLVLFGVLLVLHALYRRRCPQHGP